MTGQWYIDDTNLDTCAYAISNRSGAWHQAGRRGENYVVPRRDGSIYNPQKPREENTLVLNMWAAGAEVDGTFPINTTRAKRVRDHLDTLTKLFGQEGLMDLVYSESSSYGRVNLLPNPSCENAGGKIVARENLIQNGSGSYSEEWITIRRNLALNPSMEDAKHDQVMRTNLVPNPRMAAEAPPYVLRTNLMNNGSFENGTRFWDPQANVKAISTARRKDVYGTWPVQGEQSMKVEALGAGNATVDGAAISVTPGLPYTASAWVWNQGANTRTMRLALRWFDASGTILSGAGTVTDASINNDTNVQLVLTQTAPTGAVNAVVRVTMLSAVALDYYFVDSVMMEQASALSSFFNGDTPEVDGKRYRWTAAAGRSTSEEYLVRPRGWNSPNVGGSIRISTTTAHARRGSSSGKTEAMSATTTSTVAFRQVPQQSCDAEEGNVISASIAIKAGVGIADSTRTVKANVRCYDGDGADLGVIDVAVGGADVADTTCKLTAGAWQTYILNTGYAPPETAKVGIEVKCGEAWTTGDTFYFDTALVENARMTGEWFDGNSPDTDLYTFDWVDEESKHWSPSEQIGAGLRGWTVYDGTQHRDQDGYVRDLCMRIMPYRNPTTLDRPRVVQTPLDVLPNRDHTLSAWVRCNRAQSMHVGYTLDGGLTWTYSTGASPGANTWTRLSLTFTVPDEVDPLLFQIMVGSNSATTVDTDTIDIDAVLFEPVGDLRPYFDGSSGKRFTWEGDPDRSISHRHGDRSRGWIAHGTARPAIYRYNTTGSVGQYAVRLKAAQAGTMGVTFGQDGVDDDQSYSFGIDVRPTIARSIVVGIAFHNRNGDVVQEVESTSTTPTINVWTRKTVTALNPPANATTASPYVRVFSVPSGEIVDLDGAVFGFGSATDYQDGTSGSGWEWTDGIPGHESRRMVASVWGWNSDQGTFSQQGTWSTDRNNSGYFITTAAGAQGRIWSMADEAGDREDRRFSIRNKVWPLTFAVDVRAVDACTVVPQIRFYRWHGHGFNASTQPNATGPGVVLAAGATTRLLLTANVWPITGDATHVLPNILVQSTTGGNPPLGTRVRVDGGFLGFNAADGGYQDGNGVNFEWLGDPDASASKRIGPARRIKVERVSAIDFSGLGYGTSAEFSVELKAPYVFWEDMALTTTRMGIPRSGGTIRLDEFEGVTAPINDAIIQVNGPIHDFTITDTGSGDWIEVDEKLKDDEWIVIDNNEWSVQTRKGKNRLGSMSHSGGSVLLPITVKPGHAAPRLRVHAKGIGKGAQIKIIARRKYEIA